jgi:5-methylcytosine-specific restriction endonuclease McrA
MGLSAAERQARYRKRHRERVLARGRAASKKWHAAHRAESIAASKAYREKHLEELKAKARAQWAQRSEAERIKDRNRRLEARARDNESRRLRRAANPEAARQKEAAVRMRPGYRERAVARTAAWMREHPEWARALLRKQDAKRRAIEKKCFVEAVDPRVVFERDRGICGICHTAVDPMSRWHVDHIVPIMRGGVHSYANVQLAHPRCNRMKGAKIG